MVSLAREARSVPAMTARPRAMRITARPYNKARAPGPRLTGGPAPYKRGPHPERRDRDPKRYLPESLGLLESIAGLSAFLCLMRPITSILSARLEAGSKLARTCAPSWIAAMPAAIGWPRRSTWVCESTVSVTPPAAWSRVMLFWSTLATPPVTVRNEALSAEPETLLPLADPCAMLPEVSLVPLEGVVCPGAPLA